MLNISINLQENKIEISKNIPTKRQYKGKSLLQFCDEYIVIDLETTGLDSSFDNIIEIAALHIKNNSVISQFESLINPGCKISEFITELTGITNEMLMNAPKIHEVLPNFINYLGAHILVAHNANFDINFLYDKSISILNKPLTNDFVDTMRLGRLLFSQFPNHKLNTMVQQFGICNQIDHRAFSDAFNTYLCFEHMKKYAIENNIDIAKIKPPKKYPSGIKVSDITATVDTFDKTHPLYGKVVVFTGALDKIERREAAQIVVNLGGICADAVTKKTNYLVVGNFDYCKNIKGGKSNKLKRAEQLKLSGFDIEIISENVFYDLVYYNEN